MSALSLADITEVLNSPGDPSPGDPSPVGRDTTVGVLEQSVGRHANPAAASQLGRPAIAAPEEVGR
jgi:hypothetical protein